MRYLDKHILSVGTVQLSILTLGFCLYLSLSRVFPFFPPPLSVIRAGAQLIGSPELFRHISVTLWETLAGFGISVFVGVLLGCALGLNRLLGSVFEPMVVSAYAVPKIVFLPVLLMVFGVGIGSKIANASLHALFPIVLNTIVGIREVSPILVKYARATNASGWQIFRKVYFPSMVLPFFAGARVGLSLALLGALLAELFEAKMGLGFLVTHYYNSAEIGSMLAVIGLVFVLAISINGSMKRAENALDRWRSTWRR